VIQKQVLDPLSLKIVSGEVKEGERVMVDLEEGKIKFLTPKDLIKSQPQKVKVTADA